MYSLIITKKCCHRCINILRLVWCRLFGGNSLFELFFDLGRVVMYPCYVNSYIIRPFQFCECSCKLSLKHATCPPQLSHEINLPAPSPSKHSASLVLVWPITKRSNRMRRYTIIVNNFLFNLLR